MCTEPLVSFRISNLVLGSLDLIALVTMAIHCIHSCSNNESFITSNLRFCWIWAIHIYFEKFQSVKIKQQVTCYHIVWVRLYDSYCMYFMMHKKLIYTHEKVFQFENCDHHNSKLWIFLVPSILQFQIWINLSYLFYT